MRSPLRAQALEEGSFFLAEAATIRARRIAAFVNGAPAENLALDLRAHLTQMKALAADCRITPEFRGDVLVRLADLASKFVPYLPPAEADAVWDGLGLEECASQDEALRLALAMFRASGARDDEAMRNTGKRWLELRAADAYPEAAAMDETALLIALAGSTARGELRQVQELEQQYGSRIPPSRSIGPLRAMLYFLAAEI